MKAVIKTMDKTGDSRVEFDLDDQASRAEAQKAIDTARGKASMVVTVPGEGKMGEIVRKVEDLAEENVVIPGIVAG